MTGQHPSSKLPITRERYDELANAGLDDDQITQLVAAGIATAEMATRLAELALSAETTAESLTRIKAIFNDPNWHPRKGGITYTNRAARRQQSRKGRP